MRIVRGARFSLITHVQRDSCVLSIGVTLLLQRNSEEIERKSWLRTATRKRPEVNESGNRQEMSRDPTDFIRQVPIGATETIRTVCKETLQSLVTMFTNMGLKIKVIGSPER
jgi:hypothetical protein